MPLQRRVSGLDLLRSIAIVWVMLFHTRNLHLPFRQIARFGWMGVDLFFVLSGYLIGSQLLKPYAEGRSLSTIRFYVRRAFRILPVYFVVIMLYFTVPQFREAPQISPLWEFLTFTENFRIDYFTTQAFSHVWSLCVEEHFYLLLPLLVAGLMRKPSLPKTSAILSFLVLGGMILRAAIWQHLSPLVQNNPDTFIILYIEKIYYPTYTRLDGLTIGVLLASLRWFRPAWWKICMERANLLLGLSGGIVAGAIWLFQDRFSFIAAVFGFPILSLGLGLAVASAASRRSLIGRFEVPGATVTASLSYSLYLIHKQIIHLDQVYLSALVRSGGFQALLIYGVSTYAAAAVLYGAVERPFLALRERYTEGRRESVEKVVLTEPAL